MRTIKLPEVQDGHSAPITHVALRPDGRRLATCSYDGSVLIWDISAPTDPTPTQRLRHRRLVNASAWNPSAPSLLATASADKTAVVWRIPDHGQPAIVNVLARHTDDINSVAWMPDGERLISVSEDGRATMWDALAGSFLGEVSSHAAHAMMVAVNCQGLVATVGEDGMVVVNAPDRDGPPRVRRYGSSIEGCAWNHSGSLLAVARDDGVVDLLTAELEPVHTVQVSTSAARTVDWAEDDASFVVGCYDGRLHVFDLAGRRLHRHHDARMWPRSVTAVGGLIAAGSFWGGPHLFELATGAALAEPRAATHGPNALAIDGRDLLIGTDSGLLVDVSVADGAGEGVAVGGAAVHSAVAAGPILSLAVAGRVRYAGTYAGEVLRISGGNVITSGNLGAPVPSLTCAGGRVLAGTYNGELISLDPDTLAVMDRWTAHGGSVKSLAALDGGDGAFLSAATDRTVAVGSFRERTVLWQHGNLVNSVAALGTEVVASASRDHTVKVGRIGRGLNGEWQLRDTRTLLGPDESVKCVSLLGDPAAPLVLAGSYDFGLYAWQVDWTDPSGNLLGGRVVEAFTQGVSCMAQIDTNRVAVAAWDGRVLVLGHQRRENRAVGRRPGDDGLAVRWSRTMSELVGTELAVA